MEIDLTKYWLVFHDNDIDACYDTKEEAEAKLKEIEQIYKEQFNKNYPVTYNWSTRDFKWRQYFKHQVGDIDDFCHNAYSYGYDERVRDENEG